MILVLPLLLAACSTVVSESSSSIVVDGERYELRTRVTNGPNGQYETTSAIVGGMSNTCIPDSPGDCEAAVRRGLSRFDAGDR